MARVRVAAPPAEKPLLLYDGACSFCRRRVQRWEARTGERVAYLPYQEAQGRFPEIPPESFAGAVQFVALDGEVYEGAEAVFHTLALAPYGRWMLWAYRKIPGVAAASGFFYRFIARHRGGCSP